MRLLLLVGCAVAACAHNAPPPAAEPVRQNAAPAAEAPAPDDEIKVSGTLGSLNEDEINGPFQRRWDDITRCYQEAQARLPYLGGKIEVKVRVGAAGEVKKVFVSSSSIGNYEAEKCILAIARELSFGKPHGGSEAEFTYPLEFRQQRPVSAWEGDRVQVAKHRRDVTLCKQKSPNGLPPAVSLTVYVAPGGKVASAGLSADAPLDDAFASCLVEKSRAWRLDDPLGRIAKATAEVTE
jgi:TonB family protein